MIALSFSRLSDYLQCPFIFKEKHILKNIPFVENDTLRKGKRIHKQLEDYVNWKLEVCAEPKLEQEARNALPIIDSAIAKYGTIYPERQYAINSDWEKVDWFDKSVTWRCIVDAIAFDNDHAIVIDYKTGKFREYDAVPLSQLRLTAAIVMAIYPNINKVTTSYLFVEHKQTIKRIFARENLPQMIADFNAVFEEVQTEKEFAKKKNRYCRWCVVDTCKYK